MRLVKLLSQKIKPVILLTVIPAFLFSTQSASALGLGRYGGAYLRSPVGATAFSTGGAQTASAEYLCSWWNPALLATLKQRKLTLGLGYRPMGRTDGYLAFEFPVPPRVGVGLSVLYRGIPFIKGLVDEQEYPLDDCAYETFSLKIGCSYLIRRKLSAGFNISILYQSLPTSFEDDGNVIYSSVTEIGGIDLGIRFVPTKKLSYGLVLKNILAEFQWEFTDKNFSPIYQDTLPASITIGQGLKTSLLDKPFIWTCDIVGYLFNSKFRPLERNHIVINNGFEWQKWKMLFIRAGIRDIALNSDIIHDSGEYGDHFTLAISMGFLLDLSAALKGKDLKLNYGVSTDKVWAGLEQQLDFVFSF